MEHTQPSREMITQRTLALPHVEGDVLINEPEALAFWEDLRQNNPGLFGHLSSQIARLDASIGEQVGDRLDPQVRRGIIARAAIASAAQVVNDTGQSIIDIRIFTALFDDRKTEQPEDPAA